jgi:hypothetical protein
MLIKKIIIGVTLLLFGLFLTGCFGVNREFKEIRNDVLSEVDMDLKRDIEIGVGAGLISFASIFINFAETEEPVGEMMRQIKKVQVGVYRKMDRSENINFSTLRMVSNKMHENGWQYIVRSKDRNHVAAVFVRMNVDDDYEELTEMFVISSEDEEFVLAHVEGDLTELIDIVVREHGLQFEVAHNN